MHTGSPALAQARLCRICTSLWQQQHLAFQRLLLSRGHHHKEGAVYERQYNAGVGLLRRRFHKCDSRLLGVNSTRLALPLRGEMTVYTAVQQSLKQSVAVRWVYRRGQSSLKAVAQAAAHSGQIGCLPAGVST